MDEYINQIRARVFQRMDLSRDMLDEEIEEFISEETAQMLQGMIISLRKEYELNNRFLIRCENWMHFRIW